MQNKKSFEIILHAARVRSLQSWMAKKSCHGQTLINECSISDYPSNFEIKIAFFHSLGDPKGRTLKHLFYASHIRHNFPYKLTLISLSLLKYF